MPKKKNGRVCRIRSAKATKTELDGLGNSSEIFNKIMIAGSIFIVLLIETTSDKAKRIRRVILCVQSAQAFVKNVSV